MLDALTGSDRPFRLASGLAAGVTGRPLTEDHPSPFHGTNCSDTYLCNAVLGYDGPTGLGTPDASAPYWKSR